jgi:hypothetical protein
MASDALSAEDRAIERKFTGCHVSDFYCRKLTRETLITIVPLSKAA